MAICKLLVELKAKWWLPVYVKTLTLFCMLMQREPDYEKVAAFIVKHGMTQKVTVEPTGSTME